MDDKQWRQFLDAAMGVPPGRVTVAAVRRRLVRRRIREGAGVLAAVVVAVVGVTAAVRVFGAAPGPAAHHRLAASTVYVAYDARVVKPGKLTPGTLVPIRTATNRPGKPIRLVIDAAVAVTPDGKPIYGGAAPGDAVPPPRRPPTTPAKPPHPPTGGAPSGGAPTPEGRTAYDPGPEKPLPPTHTATNPPGKPIHIRIGVLPAVIAFTPDGKTAYVATTGDTVTPINTATNTPGKSIHVGPRPYQIAVTPDGKTVYVAGAKTATPSSAAANT